MPVNIPKGKLSVIILDVFERTAAPVLKEEAKALADEFCQELKDRIISKDFKTHKALAVSTVQNKKSKEAITTTPLIDTGAYLQSMQVREINGGYTVGVGDEIHPDSTAEGGEPLPMRDLAKMLEYGTSKMPARPHWRPTWNRFKKRNDLTQARLKQRVKDAMNVRIRAFNQERFKGK